MRRAVQDFAEAARASDIAVVYYAGRGLKVDGINHLVPTDARVTSDVTLPSEAVSLASLLKIVPPAKKLRLVILDACRDNPFSQGINRPTGTSSRDSDTDMESQTLIAFAVRAGTGRPDGDCVGNQFAAAMIKYLPSPGLEFRIAFGRIRDDVLEATGNLQEPFVYGTLDPRKDFALVPSPAKTSPRSIHTAH